MFSILLSFHSLLRWLVLASLLFSLYRAYSGWLNKKEFTKFDNSVRFNTATIAHIELLFGLWLYFVSPIIQYFLQNFKDAVHIREIRFFGMEHSVLMLIAITLITIGSAKAKRKLTDEEKFKTIAIWFSIALLIIVLSIPWSFSGIAPNRPNFRGF